MRELFKLDVIMQKASKLFKKGDKAKNIIKAITFSWTVFNILAVVWTLIPKNEKLKDVDGDSLIDTLSQPCDDEAQAQEAVLSCTE